MRSINCKVAWVLLGGMAMTFSTFGYVPTASSSGDRAWLNSGVKMTLDAYAKQEAEQRWQAAIIAEQQAELSTIYSKDPWRIVRGTTNLARGQGWLEFQGEIQESLDNGAVFKGKYGQVLSIHTDPSYEKHLIQKVHILNNMQGTQTTYSGDSDTAIKNVVVYGDDVFFVEAFPYPSKINQGYEKMMALSDGYFSYTNKTGNIITIPKLVYGKPCKKIISREEIESARKAEDIKKQTVADKILKYNQDLAQKGDPIGLLRMGERYRDGDGVERDLEKAKSLLQKAADAGSPTAANELKELQAQQ